MPHTSTKIFRTDGGTLVLIHMLYNTNKHIRLTRPRPSQMGWLWSRLPISSPNFVIDTEFKVSGDSTHLFGDGLAMWITAERAQPGPVFGNTDKFIGLGILLDTYANERHGYAFPRISGMIGDGETSFNFGNDGDGQMIGACSANFRRTNVITKLRVTYIRDKYLDVKIQYKAWDEWTDCFHVENVTLPPSPFIGYSAMTGDVYDAHEYVPWLSSIGAISHTAAGHHSIIAVSSYSAVVSQEKTQAEQKPGIWRKRDDTTGTSWFGLLFRLILVVGVCYGLFYAYRVYNQRGMYGGFGFGGVAGNNGPAFGAARDGFGFGGGSGVEGYGGGMYENRRRF
ncbi:hypothetical protein AX17_002579 [Amanita inopinata Kibby_2008]|nr:hypothetical protein AX17_002579 [Amanita inopinata Kibby_2008]